jgi:hypothetical protein
MRVRIIKDPLQDTMWDVQTKHWWSFGWVLRKTVWGHCAQEQALEIAKALLNPNTIEVKV